MLLDQNRNDEQWKRQYGDCGEPVSYLHSDGAGSSHPEMQFDPKQLNHRMS
jgi:hypothetical protein